MEFSMYQGHQARYWVLGPHRNDGKFAWPEVRLDGVWFAGLTFCIGHLYPAETSKLTATWAARLRL